jgi:hypothetical protein
MANSGACYAVELENKCSHWPVYTHNQIYKKREISTIFPGKLNHGWCLGYKVNQDVRYITAATVTHRMTTITLVHEPRNTVETGCSAHVLITCGSKEICA